MIHRILCGLRN